jgi:hypothetical protein
MDDNKVLIRALKHTLDQSEGGYGFIKPNTVIEHDKMKAKDLVEREIFEYVMVKESTNYFSKVENVPEIKAISVEDKPSKPKVELENKTIVAETKASKKK